MQINFIMFLLLADSVGWVHGGFNTVDERDQVQVSHLVLQHASRHLCVFRPIGALSSKSIHIAYLYWLCVWKVCSDSMALLACKSGQTAYND